MSDVAHGPLVLFLRRPVTEKQLHHDFILENIIGDQMVRTDTPSGYITNHSL